MPLQPGTRIGTYEIAAEIGRGGMGEVYRATDTRLHRDVALKILPDAFAHDADRLARFEREARTLAALNHPNIAQVYGLEESRGEGPAAGRVQAIVMELVEGPTLADRIAEGPIPVDDALPIAKQIADALEAAHEQGIVHRDLKPANIKVRPDGTVKVLDFGLAKAVESGPAGPSNAASMSPTITSPALTERNVILGTAAYMSPEQARGRPVDKRTDIWAFGCVLYEMLAGKRAFDGDDVSLTMARVLEREVNLDALPSAVPPRVTQVIGVCLRKDPRQRAHDMGDIRLALEGAFEGPPLAASMPQPIGISKNRVVWSLVVVVLAAIVIGVRFTTLRSPATEPTWLSFLPDTRAPILGQGWALSPDGQRLVYTAIPAAGGPSQLWVKGLNEPAARPLRNTDGATLPFWKPDGTSIGFFARGVVKRVGVDGGAVQQLCPTAATPSGGTWNDEDVILFAGGGPIQRCPAIGGEPEVVRTPDAARGEALLQFPSFLPDGRRYLYGARTREGANNILLASLDGDVHTRLLEIPSTPTVYNRAEYAEPGYLFYLDPNSVLVAQAVEPETLESVGTPLPVSSAALQTPNGWGSFSVAQRAFSAGHPNVLAFQRRADGEEAGRRLLWLNRFGDLVGAVGQVGAWRLALSPDDQRVAANLIHSLDISVLDVNEGNPTLLIDHPKTDMGPVFSPKGDRIAFSSTRNVPMEVFVAPIDEPDRAERILHSTDGELWYVDDWSQDGRFLAVHRIERGSSDILTYSFDEERPAPFLETRFNELQAQFSPDSRWLAYTSDESGQENVYIRPFPAGGRSIPVSTNGGSQPRWRRDDGSELYYVNPRGEVMAVPIANGRPGRASRLFPFSFPMFSGSPDGGHSYAVTRDGTRFLVISRGGRDAISLLLNWESAVERTTDS